ncbi:MAG: single-stranded-DNA-specific exonuclease RecJ [Pseudomonadota bacterium]
MTATRRVRRRAAAWPSSAGRGAAELVDTLRRSRGAGQDDGDAGLGGLLPVSSLDGVDTAAELLQRHRDGRVLIVGDFDADGATSTALMLRSLRAFGFADAGFLVPNRFDYGYGLSSALAEVAIANEPTLIVTVDNGISSHAGVACCVAAGVDVLVTDHHLPGVELPAATAIVNPNLADSGFASKALAGVGVAFYVMAALGRRLQQAGQSGAAAVPARFLDLVALGTVADVVTLDCNNRILVREGLARIRAGHSVPALAALLALAGRDPRDCVASDLAFAAGPRLNAAGRMEDMSLGIAALLADDPGDARAAAAELDRINQERRRTEKVMQDDALQQIAAYAERLDRDGLPGCLALHDASWHQGIVGLVAGRMKERLHRPVFAFARDDNGLLKGSGRSIPGVHLRDLLAYVDTLEAGLIERFGGHAMAAGLTLPAAHLTRFAAAAEAAVATLYPEADFEAVWLSDGVLAPEHLTLAVAERLRAAGPWGQGFEEPQFDGRFVVKNSRIVGGDHLKLEVASVDGGEVIGAIAFNQAALAPLPNGTIVELVYRLDVNLYRGMRLPQLVVAQASVVAG